MVLWKHCTQYVSKLGKLSSGHGTGKGQFSFQSQRKAMPKKAQTTAQLHSSHTLAMAPHSNTFAWKIPWTEEPGWKFTIHILLKPGLDNFEHNFTSVWDECNCAVIWAFFGVAFLWDWNENWPFPVLWPLLSFPWAKVWWAITRKRINSRVPGYKH